MPRFFVIPVPKIAIINQKCGSKKCSNRNWTTPIQADTQQFNQIALNVCCNQCSYNSYTCSTCCLMNFRQYAGRSQIDVGTSHYLFINFTSFFNYNYYILYLGLYRMFATISPLLFNNFFNFLIAAISIINRTTTKTNTKFSFNNFSFCDIRLILSSKASLSRAVQPLF